MSGRPPASVRHAVTNAVREPPLPPPCPVGWSTGPPDFVGVGFQRCGTTWWHDAIAAHPRVRTAPATRKELHFFDRYAEVAWDDAVGPRAYAAHFPRPHGTLAGEWTPGYATDVWTVPLLLAAAPEVKMLVLVRDPIDRYRSALHRHRRTAARAGTGLPVLASGDCFNRGLYALHLRRLLDVVPADRVLIQQHELCVERPEEELERVQRFLGLQPMRPDALGTHPNRQTEVPPFPPLLERALTAAYRRDIKDLSVVPGLDLARWWTSA